MQLEIEVNPSAGDFNRDRRTDGRTDGRTDRQTDRQKVTHMNPPCNVHWWAQ